MRSVKQGFNMSDDSKKTLPPAAVRALKEAEERRAAEKAREKRSAEKGGPAGPEPTRYGDWERMGRAVDF